MAGEDDLDEFLEPAAYEEGLFVEPSLSSDDDFDIDLIIFRPQRPRENCTTSWCH